MILFVCTGNTCRSPLACALARTAGVDAQSAGLAAVPGSPASPRAVRAARRHGADLSGHRAKQVDEDMVNRADAIWVMTENHCAALCAMYPWRESRIDVLEPPIPDPYGGDDEVYEKCAQRILLALRRAEIIP